MRGGCSQDWELLWSGAVATSKDYLLVPDLNEQKGRIGIYVVFLEAINDAGGVLKSFDKPV
jgi:hypothetical protein